MRIPKWVQPGDAIGVCAPSSGIPGDKLQAQLDNAIKHVQALGYRVIETASVRHCSKCVSADAQTRASEFMQLYADDRVRAILPPWGGEFLMDMLPHLDFSHIQSLEPKWIVGYSDVTMLSFPFTLLTDTASVHGSNLMNMGFASIHASDLALFDVLSRPETTQFSAPAWGAFTSYDDLERGPYTLDQPSYWSSLCSSDALRFEGRMIGGCMDVLSKLIGTKFAPVGEFLERYEREGFIWALESCEMNAGEIYRTLWHMGQCGWFRHLNGVLIGRAAGYSDTKDFTQLDALTKVFAPLNVPVIYDADIGHVPPQIQIVNGAYGWVEYAHGRAVLRQELFP